MRTLTSVEAQNRFGELLDTAQREPIGITRRGRTVAFVVSPQEYEALAGGRSTAHSAVLVAAARSALSGFRGSGIGGSAARLVAERMRERAVERKTAPAPASTHPGTRRRIGNR